MAASAAIGAAGLALIKNSEGVRYKPYLDVGRVPTVCYGHTGPEIVMGRLYTQAECDALLMQDIAKHQPVFTPGNPRNCVRNSPLNADQRDAVTSFTFNVGTGNFCRSTLAAKLAARNYAGASTEFHKWNKVNGKVYSGLTTRRYAEQCLFNSGIVQRGRCVAYQRPEPRDTLSARATALLLGLAA